MNTKQQFVDEVGPVSRLEYEDGSVVFAADVGVGREASIDVVGDTVIIVTDDEQYEFELPASDESDDDAQAFMKNGVLTVEVNA
jgi:HSP20 family molecular chaperone IbpA